MIKPCPFVCSTDLEPLCTYHNCVCLGLFLCPTHEAYIDGKIDASGEPTTHEDDDE